MRQNIQNMVSLPWKRLYKIGKPFWVSDMKWIALAHLAGVLLLMFANTAMALYVNKTAGAFFTSIEQRSTVHFYHYLLLYVGAILALTPIQVGYGWLKTRLGLVWRKWMSANMMTGYLTNRAYYKMLREEGLDNPDQRMTQDVDAFCNTSVTLFISILDSLVNVVSFAALLWALSPLLTGVVFVYAALGSAAVLWIGRRLSQLNFQQVKTEADLRFGLAEIRREAESIAFYRAEGLVNAQARTRLDSVIQTLMSIMNLWRNVSLFTTPYNHLVSLIPAALIAPLYFDHHVQFGDITQATMAFGMVFGGATFLINQFGGISNFTATINRLGTFIEVVEASGVERLPPTKRIDVQDGDAIMFNDVTVLTPDLARPVVFNLNVEVKPGMGLLICGPDGSGKTQLARTLAGLANAGKGTLVRPTDANMMFLTATPFLPNLTLRQALCYTDGVLCQDDARLLQVLTLVGLGDLAIRASGLDMEQNWRQMLSVSEQQRLQLARVILRQPKYVVMDDATTALEAENERLLYALLASFGAVVVSAGAPARLQKYHTHVLELAGDGTWLLVPADKYTPPPSTNVNRLLATIRGS